MSLTGSHHACARVSKHSLNEIAKAFFSARPHYLRYGTTPFVAGTTIDATSVAPISFPGIPGGISYAVTLSTPVIDLFPADGPLPAPLVLEADHLSVRTAARITLGCWRGEDKPGDDRLGGKLSPVSTELEVWAIGHPVSQKLGLGAGEIHAVVDEVKVVNVAPASLDAVIDCLLRMILNAVLSSLRIPFEIISAGFFKLVLEEGPLVTANQIELRGKIV